MAPARARPSAASAKPLLSSLSLPVSLLWAHQLRREHSALLARVDDLTSTISKVSTTRIDEVSSQATRAEKKATKIEHEHANLKNNLDKKNLETSSEYIKLRQDLERGFCRQTKLDEEVRTVVGRLESSEEHTQSLRKNLEAVETRLKERLWTILARTEQESNKRHEEQEGQVLELTAKIKNLESALPDRVNEVVNGFKDSLEEMRTDVKRTGLKALDSRNSRRLQGTDQFSQDPGLCPIDPVAEIDVFQISSLAPASTAHSSERTNGSLFLQSHRNLRVERAPLVDIDLDGSILLGEPTTDQREVIVHDETMDMLPDVPGSTLAHHQDLKFLKQGKFQGWDRYLEAGQAIIDRVAKRKQGGALEAFVNGIYNVSQRAACEKELDTVGWIWEHVVEFATRHFVNDMETQAEQRTLSLGSKSGKGMEASNFSKETNSPTMDDGMCLATIPSLHPALAQPVKPLQQSVARRSQRIAAQSPQGQVAGGSTSERKPINRRARENCETPEANADNPVAQNLTVKGTPTNREARTVKDSALMSITAIPAHPLKNDSPLPRMQIHHSHLELVKKDRIIRSSVGKAGTHTRERRVRIVDPESPVRARLDQVSPLSRVMPHINCGTVSEQSNREMTASKVFKTPSKRKRKLVHQLEPTISAKQSLITPLDHVLSQTEEKEPMRKKRRKQKAPSTIPVIPILPYTDEE